MYFPMEYLPNNFVLYSHSKIRGRHFDTKIANITSTINFETVETFGEKEIVLDPDTYTSEEFCLKRF